MDLRFRLRVVGVARFAYKGPYMLLYSCYVLGVPCLGFPLKSLWCVGAQSSTKGILED